MKHLVKRVINIVRPKPVTSAEKKKLLISSYITNGRQPWSDGYVEYKWQEIENAINDSSNLNLFSKSAELPLNYGLGLDERIVEYSWLFSRINNNKQSALDAGSTFNFPAIVAHPKIKSKELTIATYYPESYNFSKNRISYLYCDLRDMPLRNDYFDLVVSQSTIEHIGMDNSIYGYGNESQKRTDKDYTYLEAIAEYLRILKPGGNLLVTFPYGKFENHGFFQQFDNEMLSRILDKMTPAGMVNETYFRYFRDGWKITDRKGCDDSFSYNPHTGAGKSDDGAAHCRAVCCLHFTKK